jgi:hypothetical protein
MAPDFDRTPELRVERLDGVVSIILWNVDAEKLRGLQSSDE